MRVHTVLERAIEMFRGMWVWEGMLGAQAGLVEGVRGRLGVESTHYCVCSDDLFAGQCSVCLSQLWGIYRDEYL